MLKSFHDAPQVVVTVIMVIMHPVSQCSIQTNPAYIPPHPPPQSKTDVSTRFDVMMTTPYDLYDGVFLHTTIHKDRSAHDALNCYTLLLKTGVSSGGLRRILCRVNALDTNTASQLIGFFVEMAEKSARNANSQLILAISSYPSRERIHIPPGEEEVFIFKIDFFEGIC